MLRGHALGPRLVSGRDPVEESLQRGVRTGNRGRPAAPGPICISANSTAGTAAMIEPIVGT